ncbi:GPI mannosyltransferase 3 isoform X1 [Trichogramma pretiosum]|uniref:GPI mannosyltransferase 3 isoform X1 n=1 Tax=Trichogramma pretiosum TaxID=7493 RepID=UPI0006C99697|nr:GPI mannosyltransferase 3 isoform X1 [Trichogramma pretiosum]
MSYPRFIRNKVFILLAVWRVASVFVVQTSHVPDEYWQSLEVAHKLAFGYGYLTWEWRIGIRSYLYPFLISILYRIVNFLNLDDAIVVIYLPRVFQALLSAYAEYKFYTWTGSKLALFNLWINWYWYYCATRTLINTFEACLTIIALAEFPWKTNPRKCSKFLWIVGFLCFARPTAIVIWLPLCVTHFYKNFSKSILIRYFFIGLFYLILSTTIDMLCYGYFVFTPLEFLKINVLNNISEQYGKMSHFWYFTSGLPVLLGVNYFLLAFALMRIIEKHAPYYKSIIVILTVQWSIAIYSLLSHKEFRFILPLLPMFLFVIHDCLLKDMTSVVKKKLFILALLVTNVIPTYYFSVIHQQGSLQVMDYLRNEIEHRDNSQVDIMFLTTCHSTPYYSHLHKNVSMRFLTCEPNLSGAKDYKDESDHFFTNPMLWLEANYPNDTKSKLPSHLILYDSTIRRIKPFLKNFVKLIDIPDTHFSQHGQFSGFVIFKNKFLDLNEINF